jgi:hypothetical protein
MLRCGSCHKSVANVLAQDPASARIRASPTAVTGVVRTVRNREMVVKDVLPRRLRQLLPARQE